MVHELKRKSDYSKPAKVSEFLRIWGGIAYPLFTLFLAVGFYVVTPKQQIDNIHADIHNLQKVDSVSIEDRRLINYKLDIVITVICSKLVTSYDIEISGIPCPRISTTNSKVKPNVTLPSNPMPNLRNHLYIDLLHSDSGNPFSY